MQQGLIQIESVGRRFQTPSRGEVWAVRNLHLRCNDGELVCLLGPSGCGKTTALRLVAGLDRPTCGEVLVEGRAVVGPRKDIGFVSQDHDLLPWRRVWQNVALGLELRGCARRQRRTLAVESLVRTGLSAELAESYPHELSGGMRQRVALARALCVHPRILLMDEPFARLDEPTRHQLQNELLQYGLYDRRTLLFVTHSLEEAVFLADRIAVMGAGSIVDEFPVPLTRPRDRFSHEFLDVLRRVRQASCV